MSSSSWTFQTRINSSSEQWIEQNPMQFYRKERTTKQRTPRRTPLKLDARMMRLGRLQNQTPRQDVVFVLVAKCRYKGSRIWLVFLPGEGLRVEEMVSTLQRPLGWNRCFFNFGGHLYLCSRTCGSDLWSKGSVLRKQTKPWTKPRSTGSIQLLEFVKFTQLCT